MNLFQKIAATVMGIGQNSILPWLENLLKQVEHDVVDSILPEIEAAFSAAGVTALTDLSSGEKLSAALSAAGSALIGAAPAIIAKSESVTMQDVFAAGATAFANIAAAAKSIPAVPPAADPATTPAT